PQSCHRGRRSRLGACDPPPPHPRRLPGRSRGGHRRARRRSPAGNRSAACDLTPMTRSTTRAATPKRSQGAPAAGAASFINPAALMRIKNLQLRAKVVVEGFLSGLHKSPYHGFSVEFTEYRQYSPGDDLRYLDWKLYARSDRYYLKRFEDETNLRCWLLGALSRSMSFGTLSYDKAAYAK